ncbi:hypothetical protein [Polyangium sp. 15x6]|uniref:hypothetical protein n=1 Tax=Polyangium sp. 15x6 TaxID=3042687 RepID=UPI00249A27AB|nr:hypothetical protein [Polyangium sp. 15x6]MDI3286654.1 hypothetical protein [Polyangium sp. 15x6]
MKRTFGLGLLFIAAIAASGCSKKDELPLVELQGGDGFEGLAIGLPPGVTAPPEKFGKISIKLDGYVIDVHPTEGTLADEKENFGSKGFHVETADGFISKDDGKDGKTFPVLRLYQKGETVVQCSSRPPEAPPTLEKAKQALAICSTLVKK